MKIVRLTILILLMLPLVAWSQVSEQKISSGWQFRKKGSQKWTPASVPGTVHTDLFNNHMIPDPIEADHEKKLQWIENEDWEYQTTFICNTKDLSHKHIEIQFDGLDTYADVFLNDSLILSADNMFRVWRIDVKKNLKSGENKLTVLFQSTVRKGKEAASKLTYMLPGEEKVFTRKAQYQFGWDFGPRFVTCGIWKNIHLVKWNNAKIENCRFIQKKLIDSIAELQFVCSITSDIEKDFFLRLSQEENIQQKSLLQHKVHLVKGENTVSLNYSINHPRRWWSNGLGDPYLYHFSVELFKDQEKLDTKKLDIGLRTLQFIHEKDKNGSSFYFRLNDIPVFMKGANVIPPDNFPSRVSGDRYKKIVQSAAEANMNMLRVWGGGVYADEEFYHQCDEKGILVWQDLMFAGGMFPGDQHFIDNVSEEIKQELIRLRNHPCIALWCGNNEIDEGWHNWGWQKQFHISEVDSGIIWNDYVSLFHYIIPAMVDTFFSSAEEIASGGSRYWPSSPSIGWGHKESLQQGDAHYWGIWWGNESFDMYKKKVGRFMSEYGFQAMPSIYAIKKFTGNADVSITSESIKNHQKHPEGFPIIQSYMFNEFGPTNDPGKYIYFSQLLQAGGMKTAIEAHRNAMPYCMGSLYWQLNDCWPAISWSSLDYYGNRKASYYQVKRSFNPMLITIDELENGYSINIVSDKPNDIQGKIEMKILDFKGKVLWWEGSSITKVTANSSRLLYMLEKSVPEKFNKREIVLSCVLKGQGGEEYASALYYFDKSVNLELPKPSIQIIMKSENSFIIKTDVLAKNIYIHLDDSEIQLSDNYFDLLPETEKRISIASFKKSSPIEKKMKIETLFDMYDR